MLDMPDLGMWVDAGNVLDTNPFSVARRISCAVRDDTHFCLFLDWRAGSDPLQIGTRLRVLQFQMTKDHNATGMFVYTYDGKDSRNPDTPLIRITVYGFPKATMTVVEWRRFVAYATPWAPAPKDAESLVVVCNPEDTEQLADFVNTLAIGDQGVTIPWLDNAGDSSGCARFPRDEEK